MKHRLTYNRKTILQLLADYPYITTNQFYDLLRPHIEFQGSEESYKRNIRAILRNFARAGYVRRDYLAPKRNADDPLLLEYAPSQPFCYRLTGKAKTLLGQKATGIEKCPASLSHEAEITAFHIALRDVVPANSLYWKQSDIKRTVNPDAVFALREGDRGHWFFLEVEKSRQGNQRGGKSGLQRKCERYATYRGSEQCRKEYQHFSDFRLVIVFASEERQMNFLERSAGVLPYRWIWTTHETAYGDDAGGRIYRTPRDFHAMAYSLLDVQSGGSALS